MPQKRFLNDDERNDKKKKRHSEQENISIGLKETS